MGADLRPVLEAGEFLFGVGPAADCRVHPDSCAALMVTVSDKYQPACEVNGVGGYFSRGLLGRWAVIVDTEKNNKGAVFFLCYSLGGFVLSECKTFCVCFCVV